jgi:hypothetical protein
MRNEQVLEHYFSNFQSGEETLKEVSSQNGNVWITGNKKRFMNYGTCLAEYQDETNTLYVNESSYSRTTSKIQGMLKRKIYSITPTFNLVFLSDLPFYTYDLINKKNRWTSQ